MNLSTCYFADLQTSDLVLRGRVLLLPEDDVTVFVLGAERVTDEAGDLGHVVDYTPGSELKPWTSSFNFANFSVGISMLRKALLRLQR